MIKQNKATRDDWSWRAVIFERTPHTWIDFNRFECTPHSHSHKLTNSFPTKWPSRVKVLKNCFWSAYIFDDFRNNVPTRVALFFDVTFLSGELSRNAIQSARCFLEFTSCFYFGSGYRFFANKCETTNPFLEQIVRAISTLAESGERRRRRSEKKHTHTHIYSHI